MRPFVHATLVFAFTSLLATAARAQLTILSIDRVATASECLNVPPDLLNSCSSYQETNQASGSWTGIGGIGNGAASSEFDFANSVAQVYQASEASATGFVIDAVTSTFAQSSGTGSVRVNAATSFVVRFAVQSRTTATVVAGFNTRGGSGSASLTATGGGTLFSTSAIASAQLILNPGEYQFAASSASNGDCSGTCEQTQNSRWNATVSFVPTPCPADFNGDGFMDLFDYADYVGCFETGTCPSGTTADFNGDAFVDLFDYADFVSAFETGC